MANLLSRYTRWLHTQWPAGTVERLPEVNPDYSTNLPGVYIVGDLTGIPLLKFSSDSGARVVGTIAAQSAFQAQRKELDLQSPELVIIGGGVSGMAAALEAVRLGLRHVLIEASEPFSTIVNFPQSKPIYTYPSDMKPYGELQFHAEVKEPLLEELRAQTLGQGVVPKIDRAERLTARGNLWEVGLASGETVTAPRVIVAIGCSGDFRKLGVPGEEFEKVYNRLHDPHEFKGQNVLVVGGGDSALETAIALGRAGAHVTLSYRKKEFSRPKPENIQQLQQLADQGAIVLLLGTDLRRISADTVELEDEHGAVQNFPNDVVFSIIGRLPPLDFFKRNGLRVAGETSGLQWLGLALFFFAVWFVYDWKADGFITNQFAFFSRADVFPNNVPSLISGLGEWWSAQIADRSTFIGTVAVSMKSRSFYYTILYTAVIGIFGLQRIRFRKTPYVTLQTVVLFLVQLIPLFILPEVILPWLGYNGVFDSGFLKTTADNLFESYISAEDLAKHQWPAWGHPRAYWRAYGLILAWPLMVYNVFTESPLWWWLIIAVVQTFVLIPVLVYYYGKGAYCGWICSCGGLAETLGDRHRHKMPHGPAWNRLNMIGQGILAVAFVMLGLRIWGWCRPDGTIARNFLLLLEGKNSAGALVNPLSYKWAVDVGLGGIIGVGLYFKYSGRVWCRFACPLAALMHIYARFSRFRIFADKKKCISCNQCTKVCHQGIDIMNFANKGLAMNDPQCVRCSACVQTCPTGVLQFGQADQSGKILKLDRLIASPVVAKEGR